MSELDTSFIGVAKFESGQKKNWFYLKSPFDNGGKPDGSNIFRILPPLFSLGPSGRWSQYISSHRITNSKGSPRSFICHEVKQNKEVVHHCPYCVKAKAGMDQLDDIKRQQDEYLKSVLDPQQKALAVANFNEQNKAFRLMHIEPYAAEKKFYINVMDLDGNIGVLSLGYKFFLQVETLVKSLGREKNDVTGIQGMFFNFRKMAKYKADRDTQYSIEPYREGGISGQVKFHTLTPEQIQRLKNEAFDLGDLFKRITAEQLNMLLSADMESRKLLVDKLWAAPEKKAEATFDPMKVQIPGTNMYAVGRIETNAAGMTVAMPNIANISNPPQPQQPSIPNFAPSTGNPAPMPSFNTSTAAPVQPVPAQPMGVDQNPFTANPIPSFMGVAKAEPQARTTMNDADFMNAFGNLNG